MASLGSYLRESRERRGLSVEEIARATRVAGQYLEAIEADDFRALPAPVFAKGFIRAYCQTLGLDADEVLTRYREQTGEPTHRPDRAVMRELDLRAESRSRGTVLVSFVLLVVLGLALFAVTLALQSGREGRRAVTGASWESPIEAAGPVVSGREQPPMPSASAPSELSVPAVPPPGASRTAARTAAPAVDGLPAGAGDRSRPSATDGGQLDASAGPVTAPYRLVARVSEPTWIRVRTEDGRATEETVPAGEVREWVSSAPFVLTIGNAGGVTLELNGRALPPLGARGAVISRLVIPPPQQ